MCAGFGHGLEADLLVSCAPRLLEQDDAPQYEEVRAAGVSLSAPLPWTREGRERPRGEALLGGIAVPVYTPEQQQRLRVSAEGRSKPNPALSPQGRRKLISYRHRCPWTQLPGEDL